LLFRSEIKQIYFLVLSPDSKNVEYNGRHFRMLARFESSSGRMLKQDKLASLV
jgi:hypothetical protein